MNHSPTHEHQASHFERHWRWYVLSTLFLATFINYFDRQTLGTAIDPIAREFGLDNIQRGNLLSAFLFTYAAAHLFIGIIIDRLRNLRVFFPIMVIGWSLSTLLVGFAKNYETLLGLRYLLGVWEAVNFPICLLIIARIFPARERSLAAGIFASGAFLATLAAPPVVIYFSNNFDWRYSFIMAGSLGFLWLIPWFAIFKNPAQRSAQWADSMRQQEADKPAATTGVGSIFASYIKVLSAPGFWGVALIGLGIIPSLYFATQWFPSYFTQALGHPFDQTLGYKLEIIYFMQDVGLWVGGYVVLRLSGVMSVLKARRAVIFVAYALMMSALLVPFVDSMFLTVLLLCVYVFGIGAFLGNQHAFKQDVLKGHVGTVSALVGFVEMMFTAFVIKRIGLMTNESADFTPVFLMLAALATFALVVVFVFIRPKWVKVE
jgi:sugar phosphate permease